MDSKGRAARKAAGEKLALQMRENRAVVLTGKCPQCGAPLVRNITLSGWWQCAAYGEPGFRGRFDGTGRVHPEYDALPKCSFQTFTE